MRARWSGRSFPASCSARQHPRPRDAAATASGTRPVQPGMSTSSAAWVVPLARVTCRLSSAAPPPDCSSSAAALLKVARTSVCASARGRPWVHPRGLQGLHESVDERGRGPRYRARRVHQLPRRRGRPWSRPDRTARAPVRPASASAATIEATPLAISTPVVGITLATSPAPERLGDVRRAHAHQDRHDHRLRGEQGSVGRGDLPPHLRFHGQQHRPGRSRGGRRPGSASPPARPPASASGLG
jgi:hypothetical protein